MSSYIVYLYMEENWPKRRDGIKEEGKWNLEMYQYLLKSRVEYGLRQYESES